MTIHRHKPVNCALLQLALLSWIAVPLSASAQGYVSPLIGYDFGGDSSCPEITNCEDRHLNWGVSAGSLGSILGSELEFAYAKNFFGDIPGVSSSVLTLMGNGILLRASDRAALLADRAGSDENARGFLGDHH